MSKTSENKQARRLVQLQAQAINKSLGLSSSLVKVNVARQIVADWIKTGKEIPRLQRFLKQSKQFEPKSNINKTYKQELRIARPDPISFYYSDAWRALRYDALKKYGRACAVCGAIPGNGIILHVDHIKPRSLYPRLELDINNLQILCENCNLGKSNRDSIDWRSDKPADIKPMNIQTKPKTLLFKPQNKTKFREYRYRNPWNMDKIVKTELPEFKPLTKR